LSLPKATPTLVAVLRALLWLVALSTLAPSVIAQPQAQKQNQTRFSLELTTGNDCPPGTDFVRQVIARVPTAEQVESQRADVGFQVEIASGGVSSLTVTLPQGSSRRELRDVTCEEATATFVLIAALVLDARPDERLKAVDQSAQPLAATPAADAKPAPSQPEAPPALAERRATPSPAPPARGELQLGFDAGLGVESAVAPTPPPAGVLGLGVSWNRFSVWSPELRAEFLGTASSTYRGAALGRVALRLLAGRLSACPLRFRLTTRVHLATCGTFDVGRLKADGAAEPDLNVSASSAEMTWLALGLAARGELRLSELFELELLASAKGLFHNDVFTVDSTTEPVTHSPVYDVPKLSVGLQAGFGVRL